MKNRKHFRLHQHFFPIVDALVDTAIHDVEQSGQQISCRKGCNHCCYLLVEISWEEAVELAHWVNQQQEPARTAAIKRIKRSAKQTRALFSTESEGEKYIQAFSIDDEIPDILYDKYFYGKPHACPMLVDGCCSAYAARPSACRLHVVTSNPDLCRADVADDQDYDIPQRIEELRDEVGPINTAICKDGRWGQLSILVELALIELGFV